MHLLTKPLHQKSSQYLFLRLLKSPKYKISGTSVIRSPIKMCVVPAPPIKQKTYIAKNEELKRALSPHLSIYKPQLNTALSITLRMTGFALGIMTWVVGLTALVSDKKVDYFVDKLQELDIADIWWTAAKTILVFPFAFHYVNGLRHLAFDTAKLMEIKQYYRTGYVAVVLSFILAGVLGMFEDLI